MPLPVRLVTQGEYDYSASVEVFADGTVETFRGSYVTRGTDRRALTDAERRALAEAIGVVDWDTPPTDPGADAGGSLIHRLALDPPDGPVLTWRDASPDDRADMRSLVALLRAL